MTHLPLINGTTRHTANICRKTVQIGNNIVNHSFISFSQILIIFTKFGVSQRAVMVIIVARISLILVSED